MTDKLSTKFRSLQAKFLALNLPLILLSLAVLMGLFEFYLHNTANQNLRDKLERILISQSEVVKSSLWYMDYERIELVAAAIVADEDVLGVSIVAESGEELTKIGSFGVGSRTDLMRSKPIIYQGESGPQRIGRLTIALTDAKVEEALWQRIFVSLGITALLLLSAVVSAVLANKGVFGTPLRLLLEAISTTEKGKVRQRVDWQSNDELGTIISAFNRMQASQDEYETKLQNARNQLEQRVEERTTELRLSEERLSEAQRIAEIGNWHWNFSDGKVECSEQVFRILGIDGNRFSGTIEELFSRFHPDDPGLNEAVKDAVKNGQKVIRVEHRIISENGSERFVQEIGEITYNSQGIALALTSTAQDITERKKIDRMKNEFISTVSHELRTPLTSIHGSLGLMIGNVAGEMPEKAQAMLSVAYRNSARLIALINDLLDIEKIANGKMEFHPEAADLGDLIIKTIEANQGFVEQHDVNIHFEKADIAALAVVDKVRFEQVIANLLSNAVKFSPRGGTVNVSLKKEEKLFRIFVEDQGPGVPEEFRDHIFNRFTQADSTDTRLKGGTGLGLAICKEIVTRTGGEIGYENRAEGGASFWFIAPAFDQTSTH